MPRIYSGVDEGDGETASVFSAPGEASAPSVLILCNASSLRCLCASRSCILLSLSALRSGASGDTPGGRNEGDGFPELSLLGARDCGVGISALATTFSLSANAFSLSSNAFSRASSSAFRWVSRCSAVESCFWQEQTIAKGMSTDRTKKFFISEVTAFGFR